MPELPEVESVRIGSQDWFSGRRIRTVRVFNSRSVRHHEQGVGDFEDRLAGVRLGDFVRRGKFMWVPLDSGDLLTFHLGMSGQIRASGSGGRAELEKNPHLRVTIEFDDQREVLHFVDQRTFGYLRIDTAAVLSETGELPIPESLAHIAPDPFDPDFDLDMVVAKAKSKRSPIKSVLLDQSVVSGIGNIYADEALWRAQIRWSTEASRLSVGRIRALYQAATEVMTEAIAVGGTSFDALYVNVNGESGYFERSLHAYGREGEPCDRCGSLIIRERFANRSSFRCPDCQRR